jgi:hypothetical protein
VLIPVASVAPARPGARLSEVGGKWSGAGKNGLWARGMAAYERPIKDSWPQYLDGSIDLKTALMRVVRDLPAAQPAP